MASNRSWASFLVLTAVGVLSGLLGATAAAQSPSSFTYQGRLVDGGGLADGIYDLRFSPWSVASGPGSQLAPAVCVDGVVVRGGLFQVELDFGAAWLASANAFLQIDVRLDGTPANCGGGSYTSLAPRQRFTAAPRSASTRGILVSADGKVGLGGAIPDRGLTLWGGVNVRDSVNQGIFMLTDQLVIANAGTEDDVYRYEGPPLDRHTFLSGASPSLVLDATGRVGLGVQVPEAPVHVRSLPDSTNYVRWQGTRRVATGPSVPSPASTPATATVVAGSGASVWAGVQSGRSIDGVFATATPTFDGDQFVRRSETIRFTGLNFSIPANATITGISVSVATSNTVSYVCEGNKSAQVRITPRTASKVGTTLGAGVLLSGSDTVALGGSSQPFGTGWTPLDFNGGGFSIDLEMRVSCQRTIINFPDPSIVPCLCPPTGQMRLDGISVVVHYTTTGVVEDQYDWSAGINTGDTSFLIAPSADLSSPTLAMSRDGRLGVGVVPNAATPLTTRLQVAGNVQCVSLIETSTQRFKTEVSAMESPLDAVLALHPVRFRWDAAHGGHRDIGFVAEQVRDVMPELVAAGEAGEVAGLNYGRVGVLAVGAIQAQQRVIEAQRQELDELATVNARLEARLDRLEAALRSLGLEHAGKEGSE